MGRPSKLTEKQWGEIGQRLLAGEKAADLGREFGVSKTAISQRFSKRNETVKTVANQVLAAEYAFKALPVSEQLAVVSLADDLRSISRHMASAAKFSAASTHRLSSMANQQLDKVDEVDPLQSADLLKTFSVLTKLANDSAVIPVGLLNANRDMVKGLQQEDPVLPVKVVVQVEDASCPEPEAQ